MRHVSAKFVSKLLPADQEDTGISVEQDHAFCRERWKHSEISTLASEQVTSRFLKVDTRSQFKFLCGGQGHNHTLLTFSQTFL